jgi:transcriptional regulator with XRE-family HTH domain
MNKTINQRIGMELKVARIRAEMTQEQLAAQIDIEPTSICHWESGKRPVPIKRLYQIAEILNCEPYDFMPSLGTVTVGGE